MLTKDQIVEGLRELGVKPGMVLMVHASLSALGAVEGGPQTVIEALLEAVGPDGTLAMPAMSGDRIFDLENSPSSVGIISETFRKWPGVRRSLHPTHSACALGPQADYLVEGHINEPTAVGPGSPWGKLASLPNGYVLLMGVDQDRNTLLHHAEELVRAPYLRTITREYKDPRSGEIKQKQLHLYPGPHRDFIGLDRLFLEAGAMVVGRIGSAVCRLMNAKRVVEVELAALERDPAAVLCTNPRCIDCLKQRAAIRRARLADETFILTAVIDDISTDPDRLAWAVEILKLTGVHDAEIGPELARALISGGETAQLSAAEAFADAAVRVQSISWELEAQAWVPGEPAALQEVLEIGERLGARLLVLKPGPGPDVAANWVQTAKLFIEDLYPAARAAGLELAIQNAASSPLATGETCVQLLQQVPEEVAGLAFHPAEFARAGCKPFLDVFYKAPGSIKRRIRQLYVSDGCGPNSPLRQDYVLPGHGQGEVKELISALRCRSFSGNLCLHAGWGHGEEVLYQQAAAFWHLLDTM
ncbi:MAG: AAC(3) family N-acetyltransferase [Armatimonadetes bacterium]|nr:AAC(3) family N-acetyltransferase [Armatimonadota bacterium]